VKHIPRMLQMRTFQALAATAIIGGVVAATLPARTASASTASTASPTAPAVATCAASAIRAWLGVPGDASAGHVAYQLELSNISSHACTLHGYPGVSALAAGGAQLGSPAGRQAGDPVTTVTLSPGATSHVLLVITDVGVYTPSACVMKPAAELKVYPPNDFGYVTVPFSFEACSRPGPVYLMVRAVVAGAGIPGYSF
jgi:hypothetical protein